MAVAAAEAQDEEEELVVQNFDHDGEQSETKLRALKRKESQMYGAPANLANVDRKIEDS